MTTGWRKLSETAKQKWGLSVERGFAPTSNARNEKMFQEATRFEGQLRQFEKDLKLWQKDVDETFKNLKVMMLSPLPRVYEEHEGRVQASGDELLIGGNVDPDSISKAAIDVKQRLDTEVLKPIKDWTLAYNIIKDYMKKLEELRLTLDSRRRTVKALEGRLDRTRSSTTFQQHEVDELDFKKRHKADKMQKDEHAYKEREQQLYSSLSSLIQDTSVLKEYAAAAVLIMRDCFERAYSAFDQTSRENYGALPVPNLRSMPSMPQQEPLGIKAAFGAASNWTMQDKKSAIGTVPQPDIPASMDQHTPYEQYPPPAFNRPESPYNRAYSNGSPGYGYH